MFYALRIGFLVFALMGVKAVQAENPVFLSVLDDVPLMAGLSETVDDTVYFDTPGGRIVESYAVGNVSQESVLTYYKDSLPSLGWQRTAHGTYMREGESLEVSVKMEGKTALVRFALSPKKK